MLFLSSLKTLNIIGCGKVGKTLGALWVRAGVFRIGDVLNRSPDSASSAVAFLRSGRAVSGYSAMEPADVFLIAATDSQISIVAGELEDAGILLPGNIVFHVSGALSSAVLSPVRSAGAHAASVHPIMSFAEPAAALEHFSGTFCGAEGEAPALLFLTSAFEKIGATVFPVNADTKACYHAAPVLFSNFLAPLMELGVRTYEQAGLSREMAMAVMKPLVSATIENIFRFGPATALTGPFARGDEAVIREHLLHLDSFEPRLGRIYRLLGEVALELAEQRLGAATPSHSAVRALLQKLPTD